MVLNALNASNERLAFTRSPKGRLRVMRASTLYVRSISIELTGRNGTRLQPPEPLSVLYANVTPGNTPLAEVLAPFMVGLTGCELASVVMPESSHPLTKY